MGGKGDVMDVKAKHQKFLYPVVRVRSGKGTGSGTIIYSKPDPKRPKEYQTFVLTNHHVVAPLIELEKAWDSVVKRKIEREVVDFADVERFNYVGLSKLDGATSGKAEVVAYDTDHDLAVVKLESTLKMDYVAPLIPEDKVDDLTLFEEIAVSGCTMAHEPFVTFGQLTFLNEKIEGKRYYLVNAGSYFGNSGGALFQAKTGYLIGVPSRLTGIQLGFGIDMVTHMGFSAAADRIYEFLREQELHFLAGDEDDDYYSAMRRRDNQKREALMALKAELLRDDE
jgi:S1-C subfamily serine protease